MPDKKKAIVVDDDQHFAMLMKCLLEEHFDVTIVTDGSKIVEVASAERPAIILTDVMMPNISGIEVLRNLFAEEDTRQIPVLVLTGSHFNQSTEELFRQEGNVRAFLSKTLPLDMILKHVLKTCGME